MRRLACVLMFVGSLALDGQSSHAVARDLVVRLFSTAPVLSVTVDGAGARMRLCDACAETSVPAHLQVQATRDGSLRLGSSARSLPQLMFLGELHVATSDGRSAHAAGRWVVKGTADGLHVLLTLPSEQYVMAVLQSEAGVDDGPEALKALAVVARSFALTHPERHGTEGVCDSTHCQAARFSAVPERVRDAVLATAGETLWYGGQRVDGYFTQNCGGQTADASEVWGGAHKPWLNAHRDPYCQREPALWQAKLSPDELRHALEDEGFHAPEVLDAVTVTARDSSGRAVKLELRGHGQRLTVSASSLRFAVNRALGWNRLRSDWYSVHMEGHGIVFDGRGYGHGVGLCQAGAVEMARQGKAYREILAFYFAGTQVRVGETDEGWQTADESGWQLRATQVDARLARDGNAAWSIAKSKWGAASTARPMVAVAPDTELFRQMTNEPGWALAATRGQQITLQPAPVVQAHGGAQVLLLHEFLHVLIESEANDSTPLWLREGLVEALAGERGSLSKASAKDADSKLRGARSLRDSQEGHREACAVVRQLIAQYGLGNVRGWLHDGVPASVLARQ